MMTAFHGSTNIFFGSYCLKVVWVDARPFTAQVIDVQSLPNLALEQFIGNTVGFFLLPFNLEVSIAVTGHVPRPHPASSVWIAPYLLHEPLPFR